MLGSFRKFSGSIYAKIFLLIILIPFLFWGMGPLFTSGNQNTIVKIGREKISTNEFINFIQVNNSGEVVLKKNIIDNMLADFIGQKLISREVENFNIIISDKSLKNIIQNENIFLRENKFSRTEYEKFLIKNNITAAGFEKNIANQNKKRILLNLIGGGISPSKFFVNNTFNGINQSRNVEVIDLNIALKKKIKFSSDEIETFFDKNKNTYKNIYKEIEFVELNPKSLIGSDEFNNLFFEKIDEIDDLINEDRDLKYIIENYNLGPSILENFIESDVESNNKKIPSNLIKKIYEMDESTSIILVENKESYFLIEVTKRESIQKNLSDKTVKDSVITKLSKQKKVKLISEIINEINNKNFNKEKFLKFGKENNIIPKEIKIKNLNDYSLLKEELVKQIYSFSKNDVVVIADIGLIESYLVYIKNINNAFISKNSKDYQKYLGLSKIKITSNLYNTYDSYLKNKYKIDINYKALESVKNNFQ